MADSQTKKMEKRNHEKRQIRCNQVNLQHSKAGTDNLMQVLATEKIGIVLIQEPYLFQGRPVGITNRYRIFTAGEGKSRAAIIVSDTTIDALLITQLSDNDAVLLEIDNGQTHFYAASIYLEYNEPIENNIQTIENIVKFTKGAKLIMGIDSNSRSRTWHDVLTNYRGKVLEEFFACNQLHIINEDSTKTTFHSSRGSSNIDLTIANNQMLAAIKDWEISEEESCSDHNIIKFNLSFTTNNKEQKYTFSGKRYIMKDQHHTEFCKKLLQLISENFQIESGEGNTKGIDETLNARLKGHKNIREFIEKFDTTIQLACKETLKHRNLPHTLVKGKSVPWWTDALTALRKRTNALRRRYQRTLNNEDLRENRKKQYFEGKREYQAAIRKEKINSWKEYCNATSSNNPWNAVYKLASGKTRNTVALTTLKKPDGSKTTNMIDTLTYMAEQLIPEDNPQDDTNYHKNIRRLTEQPIETINDRDFSQDEVRQIIEGFNPKKAPGPDGITSDILTLVFKSIPKTVTSIYNECLKRGYFPREWKIAKIIPIVKPGKEDSQDPSKYRPISLLNVGGKVLEKLLINRIMHYIYKIEYINDNQYGFTPQKSTTGAAMAVKQFIEPELEKGKIVIMASLDVKGAFDAAWWPAILKGLRDAKCPQNLYRLTQDYFRDRRAIISVNSSTIEKEITRGCPQGSCCAPGLWNIQYNSLLALDYTNHTKALAFADDLVIMIKAESIREAENIANVELSKISAWAVNNKIRFNEHKSKAMLLTRRKRKERKEIEIYLNNKPLIQVHSMKYLGIIFDSKLTFREHINYMVEKCTKLIFALSKSAKLNWGLKNAALKTIYTGGILPLLLYGAPVWRKAIDKASYKARLLRVQRLMNIKMAKAYRTVSHEALCVLTGTMPIDLKIEQEARIYDLTKGNDIGKIKFDKDMDVKYWQHPAEASIRSTEEKEGKGVIHIYTDGSKTDKGVGSGIAIFESGQHIKSIERRLNKNCTNNQAEQLAILEALQYIETTQRTDKNITIYTDSKITLDKLQNTKIHTYIIEEIRRKIIEMNKANWEIKLYWVKAHAGILGNELADTLAKKAATNETLTEKYNKIPKSVVKKELEEESMKKWQNNWMQTTKGSITKEYFPNIEERLKMKLNLTQNFTAIVTGHGKTRAYLHRFKIIDDPTCICEKAVQTTDHLIFECEKLTKERKKLKTTALKEGNWPINKIDLIRKHHKEFVKFINDIPFDNLTK
jgi:ribonuclease HI